MSWQDTLSRVRHPDGRVLIGASFRGVPFFVESSDRSGGGRRVVAHEFPGRDSPEYDDMGKGAVNFRVSGYVLGDSYRQYKDNLVAALEESEGPGELIHPYYGRKRAICSSLGVRESTADGGMAMFQIEFADAPSVAAPTEIRDFAAEVTDAAEVALVSNDTELVASYDVEAQPSFATESLSGELSSVTLSLKSALSDVVDTTQELALMSAELDLIAAQASALVRTPSDMLDALLGAIRQLSESIENAPLKVANALIDTYSVPALDPVIGDTATRDQERLNQLAIAAALRSVFAIEAARLLPSAVFETVGEAKASRDRVIAAIDEVASTAGDDAYPALIALRSALLDAVPGDSVLARVQTVNKAQGVPSILLAYQLYGSVEEESDIVSRNSVQHPGFLSGAIKVLSHV